MNVLTKFWNKLIIFNKADSIQNMMGEILDKSEVNMNEASGDGKDNALKHVDRSLVSGTMSTTSHSTTSHSTTSHSGAFVSGTNTFADLKANVSYIGQENTAGEDRGESPAQAMDDIAAFYQWLPGNLVLGPPTPKRPYDGDDGFDSRRQ